MLEHPLLTLLDQANPVHNSWDLWELTTLYQETVGSSYWLLVNNNLSSWQTPQAIVDARLFKISANFDF